MTREVHFEKAQKARWSADGTRVGFIGENNLGTEIAVTVPFEVIEELISILVLASDNAAALRSDPGGQSMKMRGRHVARPRVGPTADDRLAVIFAVGNGDMAFSLSREDAAMLSTALLQAMTHNPPHAN